MAFIDLRSMPSGTRLKADLAVVGAGPVGLTLAREFAGTRIKVLLLESGGRQLDAETQTLNRVENIGDPEARDTMPLQRGYMGGLSWLNDVPAFELRNRAIGGSTHTWVGKCAAFDEIDFSPREWVPGSGWPFERAAVVPFLDRAATFLGLGPNLYDQALHHRMRTPPAELGINSDLLRNVYWQFSMRGRLRKRPTRFAALANKIGSGNVDILTNATVTRINLDESGHRVVSLDAASLSGNRAVIEATTMVLCAGGIENARLLLASNNVQPGGIGNEQDVVGRYLADHPRTVILRFGHKRAAEIGEHFGFFGVRTGRATQFYLRGLALSPRLQWREKLLNCAAYPVQTIAGGDPWQAVARLAFGKSRAPLGDLRAVVSSPEWIASGLRRRLLEKRGLPRQLKEIRFDTMVEQCPNRESRVTLSARHDRLGMPLARVNWRIGGMEIASVARLAELISAEFWRVGLPQPQVESWVLDEDFASAPFSDMAHPSGTTRMGTDPSQSVVDPEARVHGVNGLYVAGSSVFPTPGHANPTLMTLALTIRLADHLKQRLAAAV